MFLDDTACNLVVAQPDQVPARGRHVRRRRLPPRVPRLLHRAGDPGRSLELPDRAASRKNSHDYRPLGLGYANLGTLLMLLGVPYDSDEGRAIAGGAHRDHVRPGLRGERRDGRRPRAPFAGFAKNREPMLRVMRMHRDAAYAIDRDDVPARPVRARRARTGTTPCSSASSTATATRRPPCSRRPARSACSMDCDTTGIEPDFALVKFKKLAGGGYFKIVNQSVPAALAAPRLQRARDAGDRRVRLRARTRSLGAPHVNRAALQGRRASPTPSSRKVEAALPGVFDLDLAFAPWVLGEDDATSASASTAERAASRASRCSSTSASRDDADRRGERRHHRSHDDRGRAAPARRALRRSSTARTAAARRASASSRRCATCR